MEAGTSSSRGQFWAKPALIGLVASLLSASAWTQAEEAPRLERKRSARAAMKSFPGGKQVEQGLRWLERHQDPGGHWSSAEFSLRCGSMQCDGAGRPEHDVSVTALSILAFHGSGLELRADHPFRTSVRRGVRFLTGIQDPDSGGFGRPGSHETFLFDHLLATLALLETYSRPEWTNLREPAQAGVDFILKARAPGGGWKHAVPARKESDPELTAWMVVCLQAARALALDVDGEAIDDALHSIDAAARLAPSAPAAQTAAALLARLLTGADPEKNAACRDGAARIFRSASNWDEGAGPLDLRSWFTGSYAMFLMDGDWWEAWEPLMLATVAPAQRTDGDARGSFDPEPDPWGRRTGRVGATALRTLCLEVYYRDRIAFVRRPDVRREVLEAPEEPELTLHGLVLASGGGPVAGATVTLMNPGAPPLATLVTDEDGRFRIVIDPFSPEIDEGVLRQRPARVHVVAEGFAALNTTGAAFGPADPDRAELVRSEPGVRLRQDELELTLEAAAAVRGRLRWDDGSPCAGAAFRLRAVEHGGHGGGRWWLGPIEPPVTDESGSFEIKNLPAATLVRASIEAGGVELIEHPSLSTPAAGDTAEVSFTVTRPAELEVIVAGVEALAVLEVKDPYVVLKTPRYGWESREGFLGQQQIVEGRALFTGLRAGQVLDVYLRVRGFEPHRLLAQVMLAANRSTVRAAAPAALTPSSKDASDQLRWTFSLELVRPDGRPISAETLATALEFGLGRIDVSSPDAESVECDLMPARPQSAAMYRVLVEGPRPCRIAVRSGARELYAGAVEPDATLRVSLDIETALQDRVAVTFRGVDREGRAGPIGGVSLENLDSGEVLSFRSLPGGGVVRAYLAPARYAYRTWQAKGATGSGTLAVRTGNPLEVTVMLAEVHVLQGTISPPAGPGRERFVMIRRADQPAGDLFSRARRVRVAPAGSYSFGDLGPGEHVLTVLTYDADRYLVGVHREAVLVGPKRVTVREIQLPQDVAGRPIRFEFGDVEWAYLIVQRPDESDLFSGFVRTGSTLTLQGEDLIYLAFEAPPEGGRLSGPRRATIRGAVTWEGDAWLARFAFPAGDQR